MVHIARLMIVMGIGLFVLAAVWGLQEVFFSPPQAFEIALVEPDALDGVLSEFRVDVPLAITNTIDQPIALVGLTFC